MSTPLLRRLAATVPPARKRFVRKQGDLAVQLATLLEQHGWSQRELAERTGLKPSYINRLMRGHGNPTLKTICTLEAGLQAEILVAPMFHAAGDPAHASAFSRAKVDGGWSGGGTFSMSIHAGIAAAPSMVASTPASKEMARTPASTKMTLTPASKEMARTPASTKMTLTPANSGSSGPIYFLTHTLADLLTASGFPGAEWAVPTDRPVVAAERSTRKVA